MKLGIDVYMSGGTAKELGLSGHRLKIVKDHVGFWCGGLRITPFDVEHDSAEPLGFVIDNNKGERFIYATDTFYIKYKFSGITHLAVECNYIDEILKENIRSGRIDPNRYVRIRKSHMSLEHLKEFLLANDLSKLKEIYLLHLSAANSDEARIKKEIQEITGKQVYICT
jgi:phosphoribosyl 1,2-cyclic phosphodiesterase